MHHHKPCPHDGTPRIPIFRRRPETWETRCPKCHCHWDLQGTVLYFGARCPWYTGTGGHMTTPTQKPRTDPAVTQGSLFPLTPTRKPRVA